VPAVKGGVIGGRGGKEKGNELYSSEKKRDRQVPIKVLQQGVRKKEKKKKGEREPI